ncbi:MAG: hypothetical protein OWU33_09715 [Firmicutes bacterium]|nr:hypothetical protein [Bacillota bacterium]
MVLPRAWPWGRVYLLSLYYTLFQDPAYPVDLAPYVVALWLAVGLIVLCWIMRRNPDGFNMWCVTRHPLQ